MKNLIAVPIPKNDHNERMNIHEFHKKDLGIRKTH